MPYVVFIASPSIDELSERQNEAPSNARKLTVRKCIVLYAYTSFYNSSHLYPREDRLSEVAFPEILESSTRAILFTIYVTNGRKHSRHISVVMRGHVGLYFREITGDCLRCKFQLILGFCIIIIMNFTRVFCELDSS